jgi:hypothetical protein
MVNKLFLKMYIIINIVFSLIFQKIKMKILWNLQIIRSNLKISIMELGLKLTQYFIDYEASNN